MKKPIVAFLIIALALTVFSACADDDAGKDGDKNPPQPGDTLVTELDPENRRLIKSLTDYLKELNADYELEMPELTLESRIDKINSGRTPLFASFDTVDNYFVCAYYKADREHDETSYCCADNYTWVKVQRADCIPETYGGAPHVVSFQINTASTVSDLTGRAESVPSLGHFQMYSPEFSGGVNKKAALDYNTPIIYLNGTNDTAVYVSSYSYDFDYQTLPYVTLDGTTYITALRYTVEKDGTRNENDLHHDLGKYYDALTGIMRSENHSVETSGTTSVYALFELGEFIDTVTAK